ncbi:MAG: hypothetical protein EP338_06585 [Bacteroidetes bacterium]|nr:MAG: hypothetical protein EP338_06585 [Bacteroidota bacterium]
MKTITLKTILFGTLFLGLSYNGYSQLGNLKGKIPNKTSLKKGSKDKDKKEEKGSRVSEDPDKKDIKESQETQLGSGKSMKLESGKAYFSNSYAADYKETHGVGDDLFVRFSMGKTMLEHAVDLGMTEDKYNAYAFLTIYCDGKEAAVSGPHHMTSNYAGTWTEFDVALNLSQERIKNSVRDQELLSTTQGMWIVTNMLSDQAPHKAYISAAIAHFAMASGKHELKVELGLGGKSDKRAKGVICSGTTSIMVDEAGNKKLFENGPKYMRPLSDSERGTFAINIDFSGGKKALKANLSLPNPPKYYNQKWCQATSCDYDHGGLIYYAELDGEMLLSGITELWNSKYEQQKSFEFTLIPASDKGIEKSGTEFNQEDLFHNTHNPFVYALLDLIYQGKLAAGTHRLKLKLYSTETIPLNRRGDYENTKAYHSQWPSISENELTFELKTSDISQLRMASGAKKLSHAGGKWTAVEAQLKKVTSDEGVLLDVAIQTEWNVKLNAFGVPVSRDAAADIYYKKKNGAYRVAEGVRIEEKYGGSSYGKPYFKALESFMIPSYAQLGPDIFAVPSEKMK